MPVLHAHALPELCQLVGGQGLGHAVCHHVGSADVGEVNLVAGHALASEVVDHVDVLGAGRRGVVLEQRDGLLVVAEDGHSVDGVVEVSHQLAQPQRLLDGVGGSHVLGLGR